jgi:DHA3 family macrolide efflux protein-like MFS transporter
MLKNIKKTEDTISVSKPKSLKNFLTIFIGQSFSLFGSQLVQFAMVWWLTLTSFGSATVLAFAMMMALIPQIVLTPLLGPFIDRWNRRKIMIIADVLIALSVFVLVLLFAFNLAEIWHVYVLMLARSIGGAFHWPAMHASTVMLVEKEQLTKVNGLTQTLQGLANVLAPPIAAVLVGFISIQNILLIDIGTAMLAILPLLVIHIPQPLNDLSKENKPSTIADFKFSFGYLWRWKGGLFIMIGAMVTNLLIVPAVSFMPILVTEHFGGGAFDFALLTSSLGVGVILGGILLGAWNSKKRRIVIGMVSFVFMGLGVASIGLLPSWAFLPSVIMFFFSGLMMSVGNGSIFAIMQNMIPPHLQGRIFALVLSGSAAMTPLGLAVGGPLIDTLNVQFWFLIGGCVMAFIGVFAFFSKAVMKIEEINIE